MSLVSYAGIYFYAPSQGLLSEAPISHQRQRINKKIT